MAFKFIQKDCIEGDKIDLRQANAILKYKPDIVLFELPAGKLGPDTLFNKYPVHKKPLKKVDEIIKNLKESALKYPYALSDVATWENIKKLWAQGHNVYIYNIDSPNELRRGYFETEVAYPKARRAWLFWVYLYIRDSYMAKNTGVVLENYRDKTSPIVVVFVQSIHWKHVLFLLEKPKKEEVFKYYFGRFPKLSSKTIDSELKQKNLFLYTWWRNTSVSLT